MNRTSRPRRQVFFKIFYIYLAHQLIVFGSIYVSKILYSSSGTVKKLSLIFNSLTNWDGQWYLQIATIGYNSQSAAFFPFFPALIRLLGYLGISKIAAALLISNLTLLATGIMFYHLLKLDYSENTSLNGVWYLMFFPTSFFFTASYTESLFLLLVILAFYNARKERWILAGFVGMLASLTRNWGIFLVIPLIYEYLNQINFSLRKVNIEILWLSLIPVGLAGYMAYLAWTLGNPLAFVAAQSYWNRFFTYPWQAFALTLLNIWRDSHFGANLLDFIFTISGFGLIGFGVPKIRVSYLIYALIGLLIPLWAASPWAGLLSMPRFVLVLFPMYITLAVFFRNQDTKTEIIAVSASFLAIFSVFFGQFQWIA